MHAAQAIFKLLCQNAPVRKLIEGNALIRRLMSILFSGLVILGIWFWLPKPGHLKKPDVQPPPVHRLQTYRANSGSAIHLPQQDTHAIARHITLQEVTNHSRIAFDTATGYMIQEKERLQPEITATLARLDEEITRLKTNLERSDSGISPLKASTDKASLNTPSGSNKRNKINDLQQARNSLLQIKAQLGEVTEVTWRTVKNNWNRLEWDINARILRQGNLSAGEQGLPDTL